MSRIYMAVTFAALAGLLWTTIFIALLSEGPSTRSNRKQQFISRSKFLRPSPSEAQEETLAPAAPRRSSRTSSARRPRRSSASWKKHTTFGGGFGDGVEAQPGIECIGWKQTSGCTPDGPAEPDFDRPCHSGIPRGASGYCQILDRRDPDNPKTLAVMRMNCTSQPAEWILMYTKLRCADAGAFYLFAEQSLAYRAPPAMPPGAPVASRGPESPPTRGIVMCVSDRVMVSAYVAVMVLRSMGCSLPVELWHLPEELERALPVARALVSKAGGVRIRAFQEERDSICHKGSPKCFNVKIHALYNAGFDQVLLLDADNFALRDPTFLFDAPEMVANGAIFWPDFWRPGNSVFNIESVSPLWELTGLPFVNSFEQESGQLLVDRRRHARALDVLMFYALPDNILYRYKLVYGDKDLFRLAWMRAGASFHMVPRAPGWAGQLSRTGMFCGMTIAQYDPNGESVLFMHRNSFKLDESEASWQSIWQAVVQYEGAASEYWGNVWMPDKHDKFVVGKDPCYGPANTTEGYRRVSLLTGAADPTMQAATGLEAQLLRLAAEASGFMPSAPPPPDLSLRFRNHYSWAFDTR